VHAGAADDGAGPPVSSGVQPPPADPGARIAYQRSRLFLEPEGSGFEVVDVWGRRLTAEGFAHRLGDREREARIRRARRLQRGMGGAMLLGGPVLMLMGAERAAREGPSTAPYLRAAGVVTGVLGAGVAVAGLGMLGDPSPTRPARFYGEEEARLLLEHHDRVLRWRFGLDPAPALQVDPVVGPGGVGVRGRFR
jgi:hypothetical protein